MFFLIKKLPKYKSPVLSHLTLKVLPIAKKIPSLAPQIVLPCLLSRTLTSQSGSEWLAAAVALAAALAVAGPAVVQCVFLLFPSRSGASQVALRGCQRMGGLGDPWEPPDGAFELLMASQVAREAKQKEEPVWSLLLQLQRHVCIIRHQLPQVPHFDHPEKHQATTQSTRALDWYFLDIIKRNSVMKQTGNKDEKYQAWETTQWTLTYPDQLAAESSMFRPKKKLHGSYTQSKLVQFTC